MRAKSAKFLLVLAFFLTGCAAATGTPGTVLTENPFIPAPVTPVNTTYPQPLASEPTANPYPAAGATPTSSTSAYPAPGGGPTGSAAFPFSGFEPQAKDSTLQRDLVTLDIANSKLEVSVGEPVTVQAILNGNMPDPCHSLRVVATPADANNVISLEAYSVVDTRIACTMVLKPFSAPIPLGSYSSGTYKVTVNGEPLGEFSGTYAPQPGDTKLTRDEVNLDLNFSKLVLLGPLSNQEAAELQGNLPDPCHQLRIALTPADAQGRIDLEVYSVYDPQTMCAMIIVPFDVIVSLGNNPAGHYSVYVNGQLLGEFDK